MGTVPIQRVARNWFDFPDFNFDDDDYDYDCPSTDGYNVVHRHDWRSSLFWKEVHRHDHHYFENRFIVMTIIILTKDFLPCLL